MLLGKTYGNILKGLYPRKKKPQNIFKGFLALNDFCHCKTYNIPSVNVIVFVCLFPMGDI